MLNGQKLVMSMTTCRRLSCFLKSMSSILENFADLNLVDSFVLIDDSSSPEDRAHMRDWCGSKMSIPTEFINHNLKGNQNSISLLYEKLYAEDVRYSLFVEDDWVWHAPDTYVSKAHTLLDALPDVRQVCYTTYTHFDDPKNPYGLFGRRKERGEAAGVKYCRSEIDNWTTSPHLMDFRYVYETVGKYPLLTGRDHESEYRRRFHEKGLQMVFLDEHAVENIGDISAYVLNPPWIFD